MILSQCIFEKSYLSFEEPEFYLMRYEGEPFLFYFVECVFKKDSTGRSLRGEKTLIVETSDEVIEQFENDKITVLDIVRGHSEKGRCKIVDVFYDTEDISNEPSVTLLDILDAFEIGTLSFMDFKYSE